MQLRDTPFILILNESDNDAWDWLDNYRGVKFIRMDCIFVNDSTNRISYFRRYTELSKSKLEFPESVVYTANQFMQLIKKENDTI